VRFCVGTLKCDTMDIENTEHVEISVGEAGEINLSPPECSPVPTQVEEAPALVDVKPTRRKNDCVTLLHAVKEAATAESLQALCKALSQDRHGAILCRHHGAIPVVAEAWLSCSDADADGVVSCAAASILRLYAALHGATIRQHGVEDLCAKALRYPATDTSADLTPVVALWCRLATPPTEDALQLLQRGTSASNIAVKRALLKGLLKRKVTDVAEHFATAEARTVLQDFLGGELGQEAMALLCKAAEPIQAPHCNRGRLDEDSEESDSEASDADMDEDLEQKHRITKAQVVPQAAPNLSGEAAVRQRASGISDICNMTGAEAFTAGSEHTVALCDSAQEASAQLKEFQEHLALDASESERWPVLFPGTIDEQLQFHADFEGGNLRRVRREDGGALEVLLFGDTNRKRHCQWFFFDIEASAAQDIRFHIVTFSNEISTFSQGGRVVTLSPGGSGWQRSGFDYSYTPNRYAVGVRKRHRTLAFTLSVVPGRTRIAYYYPYLFGDLLSDIRRLRPAGDWLEIQNLGATPQGRPMLLLKITDFSTLDATSSAEVLQQSQVDNIEGHHTCTASRPHIVISARVHPGESPASFMMRGVLEFLLSGSDEAAELRQHFVFVIMPMLNPDGVALGNGRANSDGHDLNRCWEDPPPGSEIELAKQELLRYASSAGGVRAYLDLHAHSRRHGIFTLSNPGGEELPDILAQSAAGMFDRRQCTFQSETGKRGSARSAVWREMGVTHAHTVESGYAGVPDRSRLITTQDLVQVGVALVRACATLTAGAKAKSEDAAAKKKGPARKGSKKKASGPTFTLVM